MLQSMYTINNMRETGLDRSISPIDNRTDDYKK